MRRHWWLTPVGLAILVQPAQAQEPPMRRQQLQQQVVERFLMNIRNQAGLSEEQFDRVRGVARQSFRERSDLLRRERTLWVALEGQMRPGVAADEDSLVILLDALIDLQAERVEQARREQQEYAEFLTPVQRAQLSIAWHRLQMQIEGVQQRMRLRRTPGGR